MVEAKLRNKTSSSTLETSKPNIKRGIAWSALALSALLAGACEKLPAEPNDETLVTIMQQDVMTAQNGFNC